MENKILEYHLFLTNIYKEEEKILELIHKRSMKATLNSYKDHYIKINEQYVSRKYYMPVISIENKGDICFNLNGIEF